MLQTTPIKNGLILGSILCICALLQCFISKHSYVLYSGFIFFILYIFFFIKIGRDFRNINGGYLSFGEAFKAIFFGSSVAFLIYTVFRFVLYNFIFTDLPEIEYEASIDLTNRMFDWLEGMAPGNAELTDQIDQMRDDIDDQVTVDQFEFGPMKILSELSSRIILGSVILGLFCALITKRNPETTSV